jgi:hypothetical protein
MGRFRSNIYWLVMAVAGLAAIAVCLPLAAALEGLQHEDK